MVPNTGSSDVHWLQLLEILASTANSEGAGSFSPRTSGDPRLEATVLPGHSYQLPPKNNISKLCWSCFPRYSQTMNAVNWWSADQPHPSYSRKYSKLRWQWWLWWYHQNGFLFFWSTHRDGEEEIPYFPVYKTILLSKIFRQKIEGRLIHGSKLRREQK